MSDSSTFMRDAIELSKEGFPAPNPHVGCIVVNAGRVVGRGFHSHAGAPHAEVVALEQAGALSEGADVYVTLEPCTHLGRTPPCTDALLKAKVARVFIAVPDPNPVAGGGAEVLARQGVEVHIGMLAEDAERANTAFLTAMRRKRPYVVAKVAMSLDGRVALPQGESKWITSEEARASGRSLRATYGAVLVGRNTVVRDEPLLTVRDAEVVNQPLRIVLDPNAALTGMERIFGNEAPTLHVVRNPVRQGQMKAPMKEDLVDLRDLLGQFFERGITSLLVEGGPITLGHFIAEGLIDKLEVFLAPKALGEGISWLKMPASSLDDCPRFELEALRRVGPDLWLTYRPSA